MSYWTAALGASVAADVAALAADPGGMLHFSINAVPTTGTFHLDPYWEGGAAAAQVRSICAPACTLFGLGVVFESPVGGANTIAWTVDVAPTVAGGYAATDITIPSHATDSSVATFDNANTADIAAGSLVRLRGVVTGTLSSGALFTKAFLRFRRTA